MLKKLCLARELSVVFVILRDFLSNVVILYLLSLVSLATAVVLLALLLLS